MNITKFDSLVHYICARCQDPSTLGAVKLNKILWYSDTAAYLAFGASITGATYVKRQFGPVPRDILTVRQRLVAKGAIVERNALYFDYEQKQFVALTRPDLSAFSADEISLVDQVIDAICFGHTAASISELSHDLIWKSAAIGEEIPVSAVHAGAPEEITEEMLAWGKSEMKRLEPTRFAV